MPLSKLKELLGIKTLTPDEKESLVRSLTENKISPEFEDLQKLQNEGSVLFEDGYSKLSDQDKDRYNHEINVQKIHQQISDPTNFMGIGAIANAGKWTGKRMVDFAKKTVPANVQEQGLVEASKRALERIKSAVRRGNKDETYNALNDGFKSQINSNANPMDQLMAMDYNYTRTPGLGARHMGPAEVHRLRNTAEGQAYLKEYIQNTENPAVRKELEQMLKDSVDDMDDAYRFAKDELIPYSEGKKVLALAPTERNIIQQGTRKPVKK